ncbi:hypothetical protein MASR2M79_22150 [Aminivibrio sp.]
MSRHLGQPGSEAEGGKAEDPDQEKREQYGTKLSFCHHSSLFISFCVFRALKYRALCPPAKKPGNFMRETEGAAQWKRPM